MTNSPAARAANISAQLNDELTSLRAFVVLLESEQKALLDNDIERLLSLAESKAQAATHLAGMAETRRKAWLAGSTDTMEAWLPKNAPASLPLWQTIRQLAAQAQEINSTNGKLIQSGLRRNQQALTALQGASQHAAGLYGPDGQPNLGGSGRIIGSV